MTTSPARKYISVHTIRRANSRLMTRDRNHEASPAVRAAMPCREVIVRAANNALGRWLAKAKVIA
ncbi:hypothetical protein [Roseateles chitosanitabidus]|jgi:hypothetical protein|uniref:hypothetical protein n=1 Tax=Roseateles chitosanitabidus TaxID=65048 RepID=UPI0011DF05BB|nr:hypothetical protein [Roseateles chitosanitabidus]MBO9686419.1 hypothetical protein [Roseateles chitosanitabidus]